MITEVVQRWLRFFLFSFFASRIPPRFHGVFVTETPRKVAIKSYDLDLLDEGQRHRTLGNEADPPRSSLFSRLFGCSFRGPMVISGT